MPSRARNIIEIEGAPTDNNATLFYEGQQKVVKPKYDSGEYVLKGSQRIPDWNNQQGGVVFEQFLTANGGQSSTACWRPTTVWPAP